MKTKKRQKMCYNCEGEIDLDVIVCPFCAADLRAEKPEQQTSGYNPAPNLKHLHTQQSLYPPTQGPKIHPEESAESQTEPSGSETTEEPKNIIAPTLLLALGAQFLLFGIVMLIFSKNGTLVLKWDARLWYIYVLASIPLFIFGSKTLNKL